MTTAIGCSNLVPGPVAARHNWHQRESGGEGSHQDRREPVLGAAHDESASERHALDFAAGAGSGSPA